jgi:hypothetical protein
MRLAEGLTGVCFSKVGAASYLGGADGAHYS